MTDRPRIAPPVLAQDDFYSNAFGFYSHISGAVDPRTGMYSATIDLPTGKGNRLRGPHLPFHLGYSALGVNDDGFGIGWRLGLTELNRNTNLLVLGEGDIHRIGWFFPGDPATFPDRKLESFRLTPGPDNVTAVLEHATGVVEYLEPTPANRYVMRPVRIVNPAGDAIHLTWELGPHGGAVLTRVDDDEGVELLRLAYPNRAQIQLRLPMTPSDVLAVDFERLGDDLVRVRIPAILALNEAVIALEDEPVWAFGYRNTLESPYLRMLTSIVSPDGIQDQVNYAELAMELPRGAPRRFMPAVAERRRTLAAQPARRRCVGPHAQRTRFVQTSTYTYGNHGYNNFYGYPLVADWESRNDQLMQHGSADGFVYGSTETQRDEDGAALCTIKRNYNHFHLLTEETSTRGRIVQTVATAYGELRGKPFREQPTSFQLPHTVTTTVYDVRNDTVRQVTRVQNTYDDHGNQLSRFDSASGITQRSTYYPLEGEQDVCPPDPFQLTHRLKCETVEPGPGGGPVISTHYFYCGVPVRQRVGDEVADVYVQACGEWTTLDDSGDTLAESKQGFILDQGDQHGALAWETRTQDGLTERRDFSYRSEATDTLTTRSVHTTHDGLVTMTEDVQLLIGGLTRQTRDAIGNSSLYTYDAMSRPHDETRFRPHDDRSVTTSWTYQLSASERWVRQIGITGLSHRFWLDEQGRLIEQEEPLPDGGAMTVREVVYNAFGEMIEDVAFDRLAPDRTLVLASHYIYDDWGRCSDCTAPDGSHARSETALVERLGEVFTRTTTWREASGQRIGGWQSTDTDAADRQRFAEAGSWHADHGRHAVSATTWRYDGLGRCIEVVDAMGLVHRQEWDTFGRLLRTTLPDETIIVRTYAPGHDDDLLAGLSLAPPAGGTRLVLGTRAYDGLGRLTEQTAGSLTSRLTYSPGQRSPTMEHFGAGGTIERSYDPWLDEALVSEVLLGAPPVPLKETTYDPTLGTPVSLSSDSGAMLIRTDYLGRMTEQDVILAGAPSRSTKVAVSPGGTELAKTGMDGARQIFDYDDCGRLVSVMHLATDGMPIIDVILDYDALSRPLVRTTHGADGVITEAMSYDELGRLESTTWTYDTQGTPRRRKLALDWREDNKLVGKRWYGDDDDPVLRQESMAYDTRGRLVQHAIDASAAEEYPVDEAGEAYLQQRFAYDCLDNLLCVTTTLLDGRVNLTTHEYAELDRDRLIGMSSTLRGYPGYGSPCVLRYDGNGNLIDDGLGCRFAWDAASRLTSIDLANGKRIEYGYGPDGRVAYARRSGRTRFRYYDDGQLYGEFADDDQRRYLRVEGTVVAESLLSNAIRKTWMFGNDPQGSVIIEARDDTLSRTYEAYGGRPATGDGARTGFAGEVGDEDTGCYLLGNRLYSPTLRRFLSPDGASPFDAGGLNRYAYCAGDPVNRIDPSGSAWWDWLGLAIGIVGAVVATVATGGAMAGALAAAGSWAAAVATPSMITQVTATVLDLTSVAVEISGIGLAAAGDDDTAGILGWVALGTGVASVALSAGTSTTGTLGGFVGHMRKNVDDGRAPTRLSTRRFPQGASAADATGTKTKWLQPEGRIVKVYRGDAVRAKIPNRVARRRRDNIGIRSHWLSRTNQAGGRIYAGDTATTVSRVRKLAEKIVRTAPDSEELVIASGVHGRTTGDNYANGIRTRADANFYAEDLATAAQLRQKTNRNIEVVNLAGKSKEEVADLANRPGHVIFAHCYGAADPVVMEAMNLDKIKIFKL